MKVRWVLNALALPLAKVLVSRTGRVTQITRTRYQVITQGVTTGACAPSCLLDLD